MKTVEMTIWHGTFRKVETISAATVAEALGALVKTPAGAGYGPKPGSVAFGSVCSDLLTNGKAHYGWAEYRLI